MTTIKASDIKVGDLLNYQGSKVLVEQIIPYHVARVYFNALFGIGTSSMQNSMIMLESSTTIDRLEKPEGLEQQLRDAWPMRLRGRANWVFNSGADPEIFVMDGKNEVLEAWKFLPSKIEGQPNYQAYWDGFQAEFNLPPATCLNSQNDQTHYALEALLRKARLVDPKAKLTAQSVVPVSIEKLLGAEEEHVAFGCGASLNAYGLVGEPIANPRLVFHRFAGGHIHQGMGQLLPMTAAKHVKAADAIVGMPSLLMFQKLDNPIRRRYYGLPGEYRLPKHGLEYRTLSSAWLCHPAIAQFTRTLYRAAVGLSINNLENVFEYTEEEVVRTILEHDLDSAKKFVKRNAAVYEKLMQVCFPSAEFEHARTRGLKLLHTSVTEFVDVTDLEGNWRINKSWENDSRSPNTRWSSFKGI